jgi:hypothetical protein
MISDALIIRYLNELLMTSKPGASIHHLLVASFDPSARNALGLVDDVDVTMYAIAPDSDKPEVFIAKALRAAAVQQQRTARRMPWFAGLAIEAFGLVDRPGDEVAENRARRMAFDGKLSDHPDAVEITTVYAAARNGLRWTGRRYLTGPRAGETDDVTTLIGAISPEEQGQRQQLVRALVGGWA